MPLFDVPIQRIVVDHYHVEAKSRTEATMKATEHRMSGGAPTFTSEISTKLLSVNTMLAEDAIPADSTFEPSIGSIADD